LYLGDMVISSRYEAKIKKLRSLLSNEFEINDIDTIKKILLEGD